MAITLASPIVVPNQTGYDVTTTTTDFTQTPKIVTINYSSIGGSGQGGFVQMTLAKFDSYGGAGIGHRKQALIALASVDGLGLVAPVIA